MKISRTETRIEIGPSLAIESIDQGDKYPPALHLSIDTYEIRHAEHTYPRLAAVHEVTIGFGYELDPDTITQIDRVIEVIQNIRADTLRMILAADATTPTPADTSPGYRAAMNDAGRGAQLR